MKIGVALSGGVDSAVAALRLKKAGHEVFAYHMVNLPDIACSDEKELYNLQEVRDASQTAASLNIEFKLINLQKEFRTKIIDYFKNEYTNCRTPNPCVVCNDEIKFGLLLQKALEDGMKKFATGHYARLIEHKDYGTVISKGISSKKDQAYFLSRIQKNKLKYLCFPNGDTTKEEIRNEAREAGIKIHSKKDSQEICFIKDDNYRRFLKNEGLSFKNGDVVDSKGNLLGKHEGLPFYTIGQRKGLGISSTERLYVVDFDRSRNRLVLGSKTETFKDILKGNLPNWQANIEEKTIRCTCKIRSAMSPVPAKLEINDMEVVVNFDSPVSAVTPGQLAVFFDDDIVLGSAFIE